VTLEPRGFIELPAHAGAGGFDHAAVHGPTRRPFVAHTGLDLDVAGRRLFCACDAGTLVELHADHGTVLAPEPIAGAPDVVFFNPAFGRVYVAIGDPGAIEVFDTAPLRRR